MEMKLEGRAWPLPMIPGNGRSKSRRCWPHASRVGCACGVGVGFRGRSGWHSVPAEAEGTRDEFGFRLHVSEGGTAPPKSYVLWTTCSLRGSTYSKRVVKCMQIHEFDRWSTTVEELAFLELCRLYLVVSRTSEVWRMPILSSVEGMGIFRAGREGCAVFGRAPDPRLGVAFLDSVWLCLQSRWVRS